MVTEEEKFIEINQNPFFNKHWFVIEMVKFKKFRIERLNWVIDSKTHCNRYFW